MRKRCALTGHRELNISFQPQEASYQLEKLIQEGVDTFYCGMALGFDLFACEKLIQLKEKYPIQIIACIPCEGQDKYFSEEDKKRYAECLAQCDEQVVVSQTPNRYAFLRRNRYMVDRCDVLLAYLRKDEGGTAYTVSYAKENRKEIIYV